MSNDTIVNHYNTNFSLMYHHNFSLTELEAMIPFERSVYVELLANYLEKKRLEYEQKKNKG